MKEWLRALGSGMLMWGITVFLGCVVVAASPSNLVSVSEFKSVEGTWSGMLTDTDPLGNSDLITLTIHDDGSYHYTSEKGIIGLFLGKGTLTLIDGKLKAETPGGWAIATLYEDGGNRMLKVEAETKIRGKYSANLYLRE